MMLSVTARAGLPVAMRRTRRPASAHVRPPSFCPAAPQGVAAPRLSLTYQPGWYKKRRGALKGWRSRFIEREAGPIPAFGSSNLAYHHPQV